MSLARIGRLARTLRHLRAVQFTNRAWRLLHRPRLPAREAPPLRLRVAAWTESIRRPAQLLAPDRIELLNLAASIASPDIWRDPTKSKLWLYQLHYFDDLVAADAPLRRDWHRAFIDRWSAQNPPGSAIAWDPYTTSLRVVNWIKWQLAGNELRPDDIDNLARQVRYLLPRLEHHLLGNHLFENYKTLWFAGCFFTGAEAESWRERGRAGLEAELAEQVLPDGAHNELAPMYHSILAEGVLDLLNLHRVYGLECPGFLIDAARRMVGWGASIAHPDGEWPQFNDSALGMVARSAELVAYLERLGHHPQLPQGATRAPFARREFGDWVLLADLANLGPEHNPAHGHADNLTYELCIGARRVVVDTGISTYEVNAIRARERSTAAHNTVVVDGQDSSEMWEAFRIGRRAHTQVVAAAGDAAASLAAEHDGYRHLRGGPVHRREWQWSAGRLVVRDTIRSSAAHELRGYIHLHPDYNAELSTDGRSASIRRQGGEPVVRIVPQGWLAMSVIDYEYAPGFGQRMGAKCIELRARSAGTADFSYFIEGLPTHGE